MSNARNLSKVEVDTNGDIEVGSLGNANDASALTTGTLPVGRLPSSGVSASSLTTGTLGTARLPAGGVLQVVQALNTTDTRVTAQIDFLTASITPSSASNKILVMGNLAAVCRRAISNSEGLYWLVRNGTSLGNFDGITPWNGGATNERSAGSIHVQYLDSPSSTSSVTYILRISCSQSGVDINDEGGISSLTLMEIAG